MTFPARELLQLLLALCVVLAVVVLMRDLIPLSRKLRTKAQPQDRAGAPDLSALESELE